MSCLLYVTIFAQLVTKLIHAQMAGGLLYAFFILIQYDIDYWLNGMSHAVSCFAVGLILKLFF
jgi:hypothetical protein